MRKVGGNERVARGVGGLGEHVGTSHGIEDAEGEDGVCHVHRTAGGRGQAEVEN